VKKKKSYKIQNTKIEGKKTGRIYSRFSRGEKGGFWQRGRRPLASKEEHGGAISEPKKTQKKKRGRSSQKSRQEGKCSASTRCPHNFLLPSRQRGKEKGGKRGGLTV